MNKMKIGHMATIVSLSFVWLFMSIAIAEGAAQIGNAYDFGPGGTEFNKPVTIRIPYTSLSQFRDTYLLTSSPGRALVRFYYRHSPRIADYIKDKEYLKAIVRKLLRPIVKIARLITYERSE